MKEVRSNDHDGTEHARPRKVYFSLASSGADARYRAYFLMKRNPKTVFFQVRDARILSRLAGKIELITIMRQRRPRSIRKLAALSGRKFSAVQRDVKFLMALDLVELRNQGSRKPAAPRALYGEIVLIA